MMGGADMMRGYYKGRYADEDMMAYQAEVRQFLFWRLGVVAFASAGQVSSTIKNFGFNQFHSSYGGGIRFLLNEKEKLNIRLDYARGKDGSGIYIILKEAF